MAETRGGGSTEAILRGDKSNKLDKAIVLYFDEESLGSKVGAHCGDCWKFIGSESSHGKCIEVAGPINGPHGVCGLYVNGRVFDGIKPNLPVDVDQISKETAGYVEEGPTHCGNCEYYRGSENGNGPCMKVAGTVEYFGCCNHWESEDD
jgi:hypothetical protein